MFDSLVGKFVHPVGGGEDGVKGVDGEFRYFSLLRVLFYQRT